MNFIYKQLKLIFYLFTNSFCSPFTVQLCSPGNPGNAATAAAPAVGPAGHSCLVNCIFLGRQTVVSIQWHCKLCYTHLQHATRCTRRSYAACYQPSHAAPLVCLVGNVLHANEFHVLQPLRSCLHCRCSLQVVVVVAVVARVVVVAVAAVIEAVAVAVIWFCLPRRDLYRGRFNCRRQCSSNSPKRGKMREMHSPSTAPSPPLSLTLRPLINPFDGSRNFK